MTKPRWKQLENAVENLLNAHNWEFHRVDNYRCYQCGAVQNANAAGFPDFFVYHPLILAIECKTGSGRLNDEQREVKRDMEETGIEYIIVRDNTDKLLEILQEK